MFLRKSGAIAKTAVATAALMAFSVLPALALPEPWGKDFQAAASPIMEQIEDFHRLLLWIIIATCLFVLGLLVWIVVRYRASANPVPSKVHHNTLLEVAWTLIPVIILVFIAVPSFRLLYAQHDIPDPDVEIRAIGKQWFWTYEYKGANAFTFDALMLTDEDAKKQGKPRLLGTDNAVVVPVNKVIKIETAGADVIHSWAMPEMGVKMDAVPGRLNHTWFKANKTGTYYGQCSELCGSRHAYMPIELRVVTDAEYAAWLVEAKAKFARIETGATRLASK